MFSGIIEDLAIIHAIRQEQENVHFTLECRFTDELKVDQSVAHNGVCLTVVAIEGQQYVVTAMLETLRRSNLGLWQVGDAVNVERSMLLNGRLDGHIVQGHVDTTAVCTAVTDAKGSYTFRFAYDVAREMARQGYTTVEKGSVTINGVSLTVCNSEPSAFEVNIIPYTLEHTNFKHIKEGSVVNIEFDILGKYISKMASYSD